MERRTLLGMLGAAVVLPKIVEKSSAPDPEKAVAVVTPSGTKVSYADLERAYNSCIVGTEAPKAVYYQGKWHFDERH